MKYKVNSSFFEVWSSGMAYVLGFIFADGNIEDASYIRGKYLRVHSSEREILEKIKSKLSSEHTIVKIDPKWSAGSGKNCNKKYLSKTKYLLRIGDHRIYNSLIKMGVTPNKSLKLKFPSVPPGYLHDFIRGYFDGDGSVFADSKRNRLSVVFCCGSYSFLLGLAKCLAQYVKIKEQRVLGGNRSFQLKYSTSEAIKIFNYIYTNKSIFLQRKFDYFTRFLEETLPKMPRLGKLSSLLK